MSKKANRTERDQKLEDLAVQCAIIRLAESGQLDRVDDLIDTPENVGKMAVAKAEVLARELFPIAAEIGVRS